MKVLITRAEPAASQTANALAKAGHEALVLPLSTITDTMQPIPARHYDGIILTSRNAVETLRARGWQHEPMDIPAYCVGEKTEKAAHILGLENTITAKGGGRVLSEKMKTLTIKGHRILYPSTPDKSFDMAKALEGRGVTVDTVDIYKTRKIIPDADDIQSVMKQITGNCIFTYSALSSDHLASLIRQIDPDILKTVTLIGISSQATRPLEGFGWKSILVSEYPDEGSMINLLPQDGQ